MYVYTCMCVCVGMYSFLLVHTQWAVIHSRMYSFPASPAHARTHTHTHTHTHARTPGVDARKRGGALGSSDEGRHDEGADAPQGGCLHRLP